MTVYQSVWHATVLVIQVLWVGQFLSARVRSPMQWPPFVALAREQAVSGRISSLETFENFWKQYEEGHGRPFLHQREGEDGHNSDCEVNTKWLKDFKTPLILLFYKHEPRLVLNLLTIFLH